MVDMGVVPPLTAIMRLRELQNVNVGYDARAAVAVALLVGDDEVNEAFRPGPDTTKVFQVVTKLMEVSVTGHAFPRSVFYPQMCNTSRGLVAICRNLQNANAIVRAGVTQWIIEAIMTNNPNTRYESDTLENLLHAAVLVLRCSLALRCALLTVGFLERVEQIQNQEISANSKQYIIQIVSILERIPKIIGNTSALDSNTSTESSKENLLICHAASDGIFANWLANALRNLGHEIWEMDGLEDVGTLEAIGRAIKKSFAIIVIVSNALTASATCRAQIEFAMIESVELVAVRCCTNSQMRGWLENALGPSSSFDFTQPTKFEQSTLELSTALNQLQSAAIQTTPNNANNNISQPPKSLALVHVSPTPHLHDTSVEKWTVEEVRDFLASRQFHSLAVSFEQHRIDGECLLVLREIAPLQFAEFVTNKFGASLADGLKLWRHLSNL
eukprot:c19749_g1_i3.p1 GENE.c19749_g1_i3~~c19749_g1_i3.p1  ORF type:complete len:444 (+),score=104.41 c19749_g1_i3:676-2007(+)